ncbi:tetratricopeptide repeat protein [Aequorivita echinoideorum]|uniref:Tetratricopeptide repeat protein n=1 Tax=Aequorivita echinoideorum TaxID=1549647 RepID=A0ABS5SA30_9FLAO|nr:tetratricopeptide repeat protein [Aequorivita echinoideorum]MBT0608725.1 tetratricopeptide repeat protein [Aequorivita echinoideorum]
MKKQILVAGLVLISAFSFGQKKEIKKAEKAIKSNEFNEALGYLNDAEGMLASADNEMKAQFYAARGEAYMGSAGSDFQKLKMSAEAFQQALELNPNIESQVSVPLQNLRAKLINSAVSDQNSEQYKMAAEKLYTSYMITKKDTSDLYFAASNSVNAKDYPNALKYYQMLVDLGYTGATKEFVATNKETGEVEPFDNKNQRDIAIKTGEYIKPEERVAESKRGEVLRNMTLIYVEQGDSDKATKLMKTARAENPTDVYLMRADADMSYKMGDIAKYNELMNKIVATDPENPEIYFNLGVGSAELGEDEKAIGYYKKALELKPEHEGALINLAVVKLKGEDKLVEQMNSLGNSSADNKKYDELKEQRKQLYMETIPYLEKAVELNPENKGVARTLMNIYSQMGEDSKAKAMKAKIEAMGG